MPVSDAFRDYVLEQLAGLGAVTVRRMFGGAGRTRQVRYVTMRSPGDVKARALTRALRAALACGAMR